MDPVNKILGKKEDVCEECGQKFTKKNWKGKYNVCRDCHNEYQMERLGR